MTWLTPAISRPRAAMSVATITSYLPLLNPSSASNAFALGAIGMQNSDGMVSVFSLCAHRSAPCFVREKNNARYRSLRPSSSAMSKSNFFVGGDGIDAWVTVSAGERATPISTSSDLARPTRNERSILPAATLPKKEAFAVGRNFFDDPTNVGQKAHVAQHAIDFIRARECLRRENEESFVRDGRAGGRGWRPTTSTPRFRSSRCFP